MTCLVPPKLTKIVITGKGSTGKTTIMALLTEYLTYQIKKSKQKIEEFSSLLSQKVKKNITKLLVGWGIVVVLTVLV